MADKLRVQFHRLGGGLHCAGVLTAPYRRQLFYLTDSTSNRLIANKPRKAYGKPCDARRCLPESMCNAVCSISQVQSKSYSARLANVSVSCASAFGWDSQITYLLGRLKIARKHLPNISCRISRLFPDTIPFTSPDD